MLIKILYNIFNDRYSVSCFLIIGGLISRINQINILHARDTFKFARATGCRFYRCDCSVCKFCVTSDEHFFRFFFVNFIVYDCWWLFYWPQLASCW